MKTTRPFTPVVRCGVTTDSIVGPIDGAIGSPSVDDERAILWSVTVESVTRSGFGVLGGGSVFIWILNASSNLAGVVVDILKRIRQEALRLYGADALGIRVHIAFHVNGAAEFQNFELG